jgi:hypothetical protein
MAHIRIELDFRQYLHEKAQESRQNEVLAYLMFLAGDLFFVSGVLTNLKLTSNPAWFLFIPYRGDFGAGAVLGLSLIISGLSLTVLGIALGFNYHRERRWFMEELEKAYKNEVRKSNSKEKPQQVRIIRTKNSKSKQTKRMKKNEKE